MFLKNLKLCSPFDLLEFSYYIIQYSQFFVFENLDYIFKITLI